RSRTQNAGTLGRRRSVAIAVRSRAQPAGAVQATREGGPWCKAIGRAWRGDTFCSMSYAAITGWGSCMPPAVLTNDDLSTFLDTSDEWITTRTGMKERRISHVTAVELSTVASARALACAGLAASDVDLIVYGSCSYEEQVPNAASAVQRALGATG